MGAGALARRAWRMDPARPVGPCSIRRTVRGKCGREGSVRSWGRARRRLAGLIMIWCTGTAVGRCMHQIDDKSAATRAGSGDPDGGAGTEAVGRPGAEGVHRYCADPASATPRSGYDVPRPWPAYQADLNKRIPCFLGCAPGHATLLSEDVLARHAPTTRQFA